MRPALETSILLFVGDTLADTCTAPAGRLRGPPWRHRHQITCLYTKTKGAIRLIRPHHTMKVSYSLQVLLTMVHIALKAAFFQVLLFLEALFCLQQAFVGAEDVGKAAEDDSRASRVCKP